MSLMVHRSDMLRCCQLLAGELLLLLLLLLDVKVFGVLVVGDVSREAARSAEGVTAIESIDGEKVRCAPPRVSSGGESESAAGGVPVPIASGGSLLNDGEAERECEAVRGDVEKSDVDEVDMARLLRTYSIEVSLCVRSERSFWNAERGDTALELLEPNTTQLLLRCTRCLRRFCLRRFCVPLLRRRSAANVLSFIVT